ncbi:unnamed protein product [Tilletia controversa]|uniref:Uncharacterized protein n=3 Tax=Tilletia TaxID=13289 RepID=A0A8X7MQC0_9BASI|nr:hypothetical protein CF336_g6849 [Tilletia laevis]KAE8188797.1 hypothetical protein CF328_g6488 [Tilletia controversa]KAE8252275.1 hypothetical protein A4X03_0g6212 [Tilletia caries]KAE8190828.1 hypothetical protein CF335_g6254 [Tilletia laevis]KAE8245557.1 hypothetical protein A4X06_0g5597 [Tilletia controversa]
MTTAVDPSIPPLPAYATASLPQFSDFIELFVHHALPHAYVGLVILYASLHAVFFVLCIPIFGKQFKSGRFWLLRLVPAQRGRIIVPNHLDASATLIGAYTLYDVGYCIKLILCYYQRSGQHNLPALLCLRFIILTTIGWIFLLGFFLVKVPPASFKVPAYVWNVGIFAIPFGIHLGSLFLLIKATNHWNAYWDLYLQLRPSIKQALASGAQVPSEAQIDVARRMLGVEMAGYSKFVFYWAIPYFVWTALFATAILVVTFSILVTHWQEVRTVEELPMQTGRSLAPTQPGQQTLKSMTASAGIRKWIKDVPDRKEDQMQSSFATNTTMTDTSSNGALAEQSTSELKHHLSISQLIKYGLGLRPLAKDAYNDPTRGFSEREARAGLRSLLRHTALQGTCIFIIALSQIGASLIMTHRSFLQPLYTGQVPHWGVEWIMLASTLRLLEFYGAATPGFFLIGSILKRQMMAIKLSKARAQEGIAPVQTHRTGDDLQLSAPGPSVSQQWSQHHRSVRNPPANFVEEESDEEMHDDKEEAMQRLGSFKSNYPGSPSHPDLGSDAAKDHLFADHHQQQDPEIRIDLTPASPSRLQSRYQTIRDDLEDDSVVGDGSTMLWQPST